MDRQFEDRLATVERALTDGETDLEAVAEGAATAEQVADLEDRLDSLEDEVADLDAATQALRGYVGEVRSINEEVEETAASAMAKAESAQSAVEASPGFQGREAEDWEPPSTRTGADGSDRTTPGAGGIQDSGPVSATPAAHTPTDQDRRDDAAPSRGSETDESVPSWADDASVTDRCVESDSVSERCPTCGRDAGDSRNSRGATNPERVLDGGGFPVSGSDQPVEDRRASTSAQRTGPESIHRTGSELAPRTGSEWAPRTGSEPARDGTSSPRERPVTDPGRNDVGLLARIRELL